MNRKFSTLCINDETHPNSFIGEFKKFLNNQSEIFLFDNCDLHSKDYLFDNIIDLTKDSDDECARTNDLEINTPEIINNIIDLETECKIDTNILQTELCNDSIINSTSHRDKLNAIAGSLLEITSTPKVKTETINSEYSLDEDDIPLSELSAILKKDRETIHDSEGSFDFEFITEDEAKMNGLYFLNGGVREEAAESYRRIINLYPEENEAIIKLFHR